MTALRLVERPALRRPILLAAFGGWGDVGTAGTGALAYLLGDPPPAACATLDPELCFDFTVQRPITRRGTDGRWRLDYPEIGLYPILRPDAERDLLLVRGPEPHTSWPTLSSSVAEFAADLDVELAVTFGAFIGPVSHRRTPVARRTPNEVLDARLAQLGLDDTPYSGPTAFVTALLHALDSAGVPALSLWAAAPPYLGQPNPAVSLALLEAAERVLDTSLELGRLQGIATDFLRKVEGALRDNPEVADRLGRMVDLGEPEEPPSAEAEAFEEDATPLPPARDLVDDLERFLREQRGGSGPASG